jgi:hypothetical protein
MTNKTKAAIEEAAEEKTANRFPASPIMRDTYEDGFYAGAQHVIEHPERYSLVSISPEEKQELHDILCGAAANVRYYADRDKELHGVIQELIKKFKP